MWMAILKPLITGKLSENAKKQQWAENLKHKYKLGCVPDLHLTFQGVICPSAPIYIIGSDLVTLYFKSLSSV